MLSDTVMRNKQAKTDSFSIFWSFYCICSKL